MKEEIIKLLNEMLSEDFDLQDITDSIIKMKTIIKNSVILSESEYDDLYEDSLKLSALEAALVGVDNWDGYSYAQDLLEKMKEEDEEEENGWHAQWKNSKNKERPPMFNLRF